MLGPEANHYVTVSHPQNFLWREGSFGDLIPLLGDGLLTIDGAYHDRARRIMMPAFHRERIEASISTMAAETERAAGERWSPGRSSTSMTGRAIWPCGSRCGRCSASTPTTAARARRRRITSSARSASTASTTPSACCAGPGSPWRKLLNSRAVLDEIVFGEIASGAGAPTPSAATSSAC